MATNLAGKASTRSVSHLGPAWKVAVGRLFLQGVDPFFVISGNRVRGQRLITTMFQILFALPLSSKPKKSRDYSTLDVHFGFTKAFTYLLLEELTSLLINMINLTKITSKGLHPSLVVPKMEVIIPILLTSNQGT